MNIQLVSQEQQKSLDEKEKKPFNPGKAGKSSFCMLNS